MRHACSEVIRIAKESGATALVIEDLGFDTGRESCGRPGRTGKKFRHQVAGMPVSKFAARLVAMAHRAHLAVIVVDPAHSSRWGAQHWKQATSTKSEKTSGHQAAAVVMRRPSPPNTVRSGSLTCRPGRRTHYQSVFRNGYAYHQKQHIVSVKRAMLDSAARNVLLIDHTKLARTALHRVVPLSRFDLLVDDGATADALRDLAEHKVPYEVCATNATNATRGGDDPAGAT